MTITTLITLLSLATWRISCDYTQEYGPFGAYYLLRTTLKAWAEAQIDASSVADPKDHGWYWLYDGADCFVCVSLWVAGLLTFIAWLGLGITSGITWNFALFILYWCSATAGARLIDLLFTRLQPPQA